MRRITSSMASSSIGRSRTANAPSRSAAESPRALSRATGCQSPTIGQTAQAYADELASQGCNLIHSDGPYGENLAASSAELTAQGTVDLWMTEEPCYTGAGLESCSCDCGHVPAVAAA